MLHPARHQLKRIHRAAFEALEPRQLFSAPPLPVIPSGVFNITTFGATTASANNATDIQAAITAASKAGGGTVEIPAGTFMSGPITLSSSINLQLDSGAMLQALSMANYPNNTNPAHFITISSKNNVEISGSGTIDGNGSAWWAAYNASGGTINRPRLINATGDTTVYLTGVTLQNSPMFNFAISSSNNVTVNGITILNPSNSPNTDGMDIAGAHYLVENCTIDTGDDNIVCKPGSSACSDMTITNCFFGSGHGMSIGGQTGDGLNGLTVTNCTFDGTTTGIRMKCDRRQDNGGLVQNCTYSNITMYNVQYPININTYYNDGTIPSNSETSDPAQAITSNTPFWQNITISNLTATWDSTRASYSSSAQNGSYTGILWGLPEAPILNLAMSNVKISGAKLGIDIDHVRNVTFDSQCSFSNTSGGEFIASSATATPIDAQVIASGWSDTDIGTPTPTTTALYNPNTNTQSMLIGGSGWTGTSDQFNLESQSITGNALVSALVSSLQTSNSGGQAGVMFRDGTAAGADFAAVVEQTNKQVVFEYRSTTGGAVQISAPVGDTTSAKYVKLTRVGNTFSAFYSTSGTAWTAIASPVSITMSSTLSAGPCDTSGTTSAITSASFSSATVINDNTPPTLSSDAYLFNVALNKLSFTFSENVAASLSTGSLSVLNSQNAPISVAAMSYDSTSNTATFTLNSAISDGDYTATLNGASTTDAVGNPLAGGNASLGFFVLPADANRDGTVNAQDFAILAAHYGTAGTLATGDFNFDGQVNALDFNILASQFNTVVPAPAPPAAAPLGTLFAAPSASSQSAIVAEDWNGPLSLAGDVL